MILMGINRNNLHTTTILPCFRLGHQTGNGWHIRPIKTKNRNFLFVTSKRIAVQLCRRMEINSTPAWAPGKFELAATLFVFGRSGNLYVDRKREIIKRLTYSNGIDSSPTFSPGGNKMAFVSKRSGTPQVYVMDLDSGSSRRLTYTGRYNTQPNWSPAGDKSHLQRWKRASPISMLLMRMGQVRCS